MKRILLLCVAVIVMASTAHAQNQEEKVSIPKSMLTSEQLSELHKQNLQSWAGIGKELGEAVNSSLQAITTQSNNFAQTPVGKLTVLLVVWKVVGDQFVHVASGLLELLVFVPLWIWSYRRTCMARKIKLPDKTIKVVEYDDGRGDFTPRNAHLLAIVLIVVIFLCTTFSY